MKTTEISKDLSGLDEKLNILEGGDLGKLGWDIRVYVLMKAINAWLHKVNIESQRKTTVYITDQIGIVIIIHIYL